MASTVLPNGIIIPEKYSRDWYSDLYHNWEELDNLLGGGTPKDGTLTIQKNGATVGTFSANQASDETINITVPDVNNGTLTIQQNGATVDTFTANSSSDKTVNIQCVDLNSNQTIGGNKEFTGITTAHDVVPSATDTYNFGSPSYQWSNAYIKSLTINGVACGDILTHNASEFVGVSGDQTIGGTKTFSSSPRVTKTSPDIALNISDCDVTEIPTEVKYASLYFRDKNNIPLSYIVSQQRTVGTKKMCLRTHRTDNINSYYSVDLDSDGNFYPEQSINMNLGTSACKWKSVYTKAINDLNPGALSLPSSSYINVDTTNWVLDGNPNRFIPDSDGWFGIQAIDTVYDQMHYVFVGRTGGSAYYQQNLISPINALWDNKYHGSVFIPVVKNVNYDIRCICDSVVAVFYPCQGNV